MTFLCSSVWLKLCLGPVHSWTIQEGNKIEDEGVAVSVQTVWRMVGSAGVDWRRADLEVFLIGNLERSAIEWRDQTDMGVFRLTSLSLGVTALSVLYMHPDVPSSRLTLLCPLPPPFPGSVP